MQGRGSGIVREFALFGETTGETDDFGLPVRYNWAADYRGKGLVVYGHTPQPEPLWLNNTVNIDTGCAFGEALAPATQRRLFLSAPMRPITNQAAISARRAEGTRYREVDSAGFGRRIGISRT